MNTDHPRRRSPRGLRAMGHDPNRGGYVPSRVPLMTLVGSPAQRILCTTSLVFAHPARKNQVPTGPPCRNLICSLLTAVSGAPDYSPPFRGRGLLWTAGAWPGAPRRVPSGVRGGRRPDHRAAPKSKFVSPHPPTPSPSPHPHRRVRPSGTEPPAPDPGRRGP